MLSLVLCFLFLAVLTAASTPGTQTILLIKGGYGVGANLLSRSSRTTQISPVTSLAVTHGSEASALLAATKTTANLMQELQEAVRYASSSEDEKYAEQAQVAQLSKEAAEEKRSLQGMRALHNQHTALEKEVAQLKQALKAEQVLERKEATKDNALSTKVAELGRDMTVTNRAWRAAALKARAQANDLEKVIQGIKKKEEEAKPSSKSVVQPIVAKQHADSAGKVVAAKQTPTPAAKPVAANSIAKMEKYVALKVATPAKKQTAKVQHKTGVTSKAKTDAAESEKQQDLKRAEDEAEAEVDAEDEGETDSNGTKKEMAAKKVKNASESDADVEDQGNDADVDADSDTDSF